MMLVANPANLHAIPVERQAEVLADAQQLVKQYAHRYNGSLPPAELERKARQRRRARQTHPGKR
jgi:hypothetical protein